MTMGLIWTLIIGGIIGAVAKWIMPGKDPGGIFATIALGVAGSWLGSLLLPNWLGWIGSVLGALLLLWLYRKFVGRSVEV
jgi:uncharacterized membrane protein YeaQ/YmgE (transglycosylase-associated protein family)